MVNFWALWLRLHKRSYRGFTFIEVLAGILIATTFTLIATQAIVIGTVFKVRARRISEATNIIRADLEELRFIATTNNQDLEGQLSLLCQSTNFINTFNLSLPQPKSPQTILNKEYELNRVASYPEWNVLRLSYSVQDENDVVIAELQAEITPNAAANCASAR
jgi:type II secretory pathway pseudopilin PulG